MDNKKSRAEDRKRRLAKVLKANLLKRKAKAKGAASSRQTTEKNARD
jgi:hypothetical protein